jgi:hypothetical protein
MGGITEARVHRVDLSQASTLHAQEHALSGMSAPQRREGSTCRKEAPSTGLVDGQSSGIVDYDYEQDYDYDLLAAMPRWALCG